MWPGYTVALTKPLLPPFKPPAPSELSVADLLPPREAMAPMVVPDTATEAFKSEVRITLTFIEPQHDEH